MKVEADHVKIEKIEKLRSIAHVGISMNTISQIFRLLHHRDILAKEFLTMDETSLENAIKYIDKLNEDICALLGITISN
jgi:hypothetical protein